jgi:hypothetical protein
MPSGRQHADITPVGPVLGCLPILQGTRASNRRKENDGSAACRPLQQSSSHGCTLRMAVTAHSVSSEPYAVSALSWSHARNVLRAFYAPRLPGAARTITVHIKCGVVRLLCRRLYLDADQLHSPLCSPTALVVPTIVLKLPLFVCGASGLGGRNRNPSRSVHYWRSRFCPPTPSRAPASLEPARPALACTLLCWLPRQVSQLHRNLNAGPPNNALRLRLGAGPLAFRLPPDNG